MRSPFPAALLFLLAACGGGGGGNDTAGGGNAAEPAPRPTGPPPNTPVMNITPAPGNEASWMQPREAPGAPKTAPYGNLLDQPVVNGAAAR